MAVTHDDVRHVARLARLGIPESALKEYVAQLNSILGHMEVLARVPATTDADAPAPGMALREDRVDPVRLQRPLESFAPAARDGFILVPRLATHEDSGEGA